MERGEGDRRLPIECGGVFVVVSLSFRRNIDSLLTKENSTIRFGARWDEEKMTSCCVGRSN